jgi:hypothetical protein
MPGSIDNLSPMDDYMAFLSATHLNKGESSQGGDDADDGKRSAGEVLTFAFKGKKISDLDASIQPGEVELGPASVLKADGTYWVNGTQVATGRFTNSLTSLAWNATPTTGVTVWNVWAEVDCRDDAANSVFPKWRIMEGETITPLYDGGSPTEEFNIKWTRQKKILIIALVDDKITTVKNLQCGNIDISHL